MRMPSETFSKALLKLKYTTPTASPASIGAATLLWREIRLAQHGLLFTTPSCYSPPTYLLDYCKLFSLFYDIFFLNLLNEKEMSWIPE